MYNVQREICYEYPSSNEHLYQSNYIFLSKDIESYNCTVGSRGGSRNSQKEGWRVGGISYFTLELW